MRAAAVDLAESWRRAVQDAVATFDYGATIPRRWLLDAFGIAFPEVGTPEEIQRVTLQLFSAMTLFRDELLYVHRRALKSVGHGDYQVVPPPEQHALALDHARRGIARSLRKAHELAEHTDLRQLSLEQARARNEAIAKLAAIEAHVAKRLGPPAPALPSNDDEPGE